MPASNTPFLARLHFRPREFSRYRLLIFIHRSVLLPSALALFSTTKKFLFLLLPSHPHPVRKLFKLPVTTQVHSLPDFPSPVILSHHATHNPPQILEKPSRREIQRTSTVTMPRKTSAEFIIDAIVENGDAPMDRAALQDFFMDRTNSFVDFRKLWEFYEAFIGGYHITARSLNTMRSKGGKAFATKIKARLDSEPGVVPAHLIDFFNNHQYIWDSSLGDGDTQAEPGRLPKELLDQLKRICPDRESFEGLLMQQMTAQSVPSGMDPEVAAKLMSARAKEVAEEAFGKDESATDGLIAAVKKGTCPSFEVTKTFRGYGFEVICHRDDVAKLFDIYVLLINTCGVSRDTLNKWMVSGKQTLGQNIKVELEKKQEIIPVDLIPWLDANQYIWARGGIAFSGQTNALVRHPGVRVDFQRFVKPVKPEEQAKINQEMQELVDSFHNLEPGEPEFNLQEEIERRANKYGCYQVAMTYPKKDEISDEKKEVGTDGK